MKKEEKEKIEWQEKWKNEEKLLVFGSAQLEKKRRPYLGTFLLDLDFVEEDENQGRRKKK